MELSIGKHASQAQSWWMIWRAAGSQMIVMFVLIREAWCDNWYIDSVITYSNEKCKILTVQDSDCQKVYIEKYTPVEIHKSRCLQSSLLLYVNCVDVTSAVAATPNRLLFSARNPFFSRCCRIDRLVCLVLPSIAVQILWHCDGRRREQDQMLVARETRRLLRVLFQLAAEDRGEIQCQLVCVFAVSFGKTHVSISYIFCCASTRFPPVRNDLCCVGCGIKLTHSYSDAVVGWLEGRVACEVAFVSIRHFNRFVSNLLADWLIDWLIVPHVSIKPGLVYATGR